MYYKILNKESEVYKKLHEMRTLELQMEEDNKKAIEEKTGMTWESYFGRRAQATFNRTTDYMGFEFIEKDKVDPKIWKQDKSDPKIYMPNTRTKVGRDMAEFLNNGLKGHRFSKIFDIIECERPNGSFNWPYVEIFDDIIVMFLDAQNVPADKENVIEITSVEFNSIREAVAEEA